LNPKKEVKPVNGSGNKRGVTAGKTTNLKSPTKTGNNKCKHKINKSHWISS